jgi:DNA polymerase-3 subunit alpha (Gram-positive type)
VKERERLNKLIQEFVSWDRLPEENREQMECVIEDAQIRKETGVLSMDMRLNFIIPAEDDRKLKEAVIRQLQGLTGVELRYHYERDQMALSEEDILRLYLPRLIRESESFAKVAFDPSRVQIRGRSAVLGSFGRMATEKLNGELASELARKVQEAFGFTCQVRFENDEKRYEEVGKKRNSELTDEEIYSAPGADVYSDAGAMTEFDAFDQSMQNAQDADADQLLAAYGGMTPDMSADDAGMTPPWEDVSGSSGSGKTAAPSGLSRSRRDESGTGHARKARTSGQARNTQGGARRGTEVVLGRGIRGTSVPLMQLTPDSGKVIIEGVVFHKENRPIKNNKQIVTLLITDKKTSVCVKSFLKNEKWDDVDSRIKEGDYIICQGETEWSKYDNALNVIVRDISKGEGLPKREDTWENGRRVELHCHTKMSAMDALNDPERIVQLASDWGQPAVAITDHGVVQSFPDAAAIASKLAKKGKPIKVIYGMEGYLYDDEGCIDADGNIDYKKKKGTNHIILLCRTQEGLRNLYKLVSISHVKYFYKKPRIPRTVLDKYREGLIVGSACEAGEVYRALEQGKSDEEVAEIAKYYDYLEIQPLINNRFMLDADRFPDVNTWEDLKEYNRKIVRIADTLGKPVCATTDAHYDEPDSAIYRNILLYGMGFKDAENGQGLYLRTTNEMIDEFSYLGEETAQKVVVDNTNRIANWVEDGIKPVPDEKCPPKIDGAEEELYNKCFERAHRIYGDPLPNKIQERLDTELNAIISNGYAVMYVSAERLVNKSLQDGYLVGSRGSVGSSFAATMAGITEVNPLDPHYICPNCKHLEWGDMTKYDNGLDMPPKKCPECGAEMKRDGFTIPFATFLGFKGNKEPDIDLNFAGEYQARAHKYVGVIFGEKNVFKAGTVGTIAEKTAYGYVRRFFEETGRAVNKFEIDRLTEGCTGVKRTTGQHPGGIIIVPRDHDIFEFCPIQHPANDTKTDIITTHFDYHKIDKNLLKLDILGHTVPSMIRQLQDMTGVDPLHVDLTDQKVLSIFNGTEALDIKDPDYRFRHGTFAIPEFGTGFTRQMLDDVKPKRFEDLVRMSGFSHGTDVWLNNAQEYIRNGTATMREVISTRDDIMNFCIAHGIENETSFRIMEETRKKNLVLTEEHKQEMRDHGIPQWYIDSCSKIKYMFPRAHAVAYVMMSFRMAWYKVYYPVPFYATYFTSVLADFDAETALKGKEAVLRKMDEINMKGNNATAKEKDSETVLEVIYEMYARGFEFLPAELGTSYAERFWEKDGKVLLPFAAYEGVGAAAANQLVDAYNEKPFDTVEDCQTRAHLGKGVIETLRAHGIFEGLPETDQICWAI